MLCGNMSAYFLNVFLHLFFECLFTHFFIRIELNVYILIDC